MAVSFVTELEVLSYPGITIDEERTLRNFLNEIQVVDINKAIKEQAIALRKRYNLKLPDAIIAGTAFFLKVALVTNDRGFAKVKEIQTKSVSIKTP